MSIYTIEERLEKLEEEINEMFNWFNGIRQAEETEYDKRLIKLEENFRILEGQFESCTCRKALDDMTIDELIERVEKLECDHFIKRIRRLRIKKFKKKHAKHYNLNDFIDEDENET